MPIFYTLGMKDWVSAVLYAGILLILYHLYDYLARREFISLRRTLISFLAVVAIAGTDPFSDADSGPPEASRQISIEDVSAVALAPASTLGSRQHEALLQLKLDDPELTGWFFKAMSTANTPKVNSYDRPDLPGPRLL